MKTWYSSSVGLGRRTHDFQGSRKPLHSVPDALESSAHQNPIADLLGLFVLLPSSLAGSGAPILETHIWVFDIREWNETKYGNNFG